MCIHTLVIFSGSSNNKMTTNASQGPIYFCSNGHSKHRWPTTVCVYTALCLIHTIFVLWNIIFDALIQALTDGQIHFRPDLQSGTAAQTDFLCALAKKETKLEKMSKLSKTAAIIMLFNFPTSWISVDVPFVHITESYRTLHCGYSTVNCAVKHWAHHY